MFPTLHHEGSVFEAFDSSEEADIRARAGVYGKNGTGTSSFMMHGIWESFYNLIELY